MSDAYTIDNLFQNKHDGLWYERETTVPFSGTLTAGYDRGTIKNGKPEGHWRLYAYFVQLEAEGWGFPDSNHVDGWHLGSEGEMKNGQAEGPWVEYEWQSGKVLAKGDYKNGKQEGPWLWYHDNGQVSAKGEFKNGEREGPWLWYHDNGQLADKGAYKNGEMEGPWVEYHNNGRFRGRARSRAGNAKALGSTTTKTAPRPTTQASTAMARRSPTYPPSLTKPPRQRLRQLRLLPMTRERTPQRGPLSRNAALCATAQTNLRSSLSMQKVSFIAMS